MRKVIYVFSISLFALLLLTGCGKDKGLVGVWYYDGMSDTYYTFNEDKTCSYTYMGSTSNCTYEDDETRVTIMYEGKTIANVFEYTIDGNKLTILDSYGNENIYRKK